MRNFLAGIILYIGFTAIIYTGQIHCAEVEIRGTYGGLKKFWDAGHTLDKYHINAVFVGSYGISEELVNRARAEGAKVYSEFATLNGHGYLENHPEAWPIDRYGNRSPQADWFMGICPTNPEFRAYRMKALRELLRAYDLDGIWMDYVHWHAQFESPNPILPEICFCDNCLRTFEASTGIDVPDEGTTTEKADWILANYEPVWRDWRCGIITGWARDMKSIIGQERPGALLGIYHAPWNDSEFEGARRRILGLDFEQLAGVVDVFSPMVYHGRMERRPEWVREYVDWFCDRLNIDSSGYPKVWPIVQGSDDPGVVSAEEFENVLRWGVSSQASGVMMFTIHGISDNPEKMAVLEKVYGMWE